MIDAYLLDTNIISALSDANRDDHLPALERFQAVDKNYVMLPSMAVAEVQAGLERGLNLRPEKRAKVEDFLSKFHQVPFDEFCARPYAVVRAELWLLHGTVRLGSGRRKTKERLPEELKDCATGKEMGIEEPDLIIASIAMAQNFLLVTNDENAGMARVKEAAMHAFQKGRFPCQLRTEKWR